jgi:hypothetical protein
VHTTEKKESGMNKKAQGEGRIFAKYLLFYPPLFVKL